MCALVDHHRPTLDGKCREALFAVICLWEEAFEGELTCQQSACTDCGNRSAGTWNGFHDDATVDGCPHKLLPGVTDTGCPRIGDQSDIVSLCQQGDQVNDVFLPGVRVMADKAGVDIKVTKEFAGYAGVFCGDDV